MARGHVNRPRLNGIHPREESRCEKQMESVRLHQGVGRGVEKERDQNIGERSVLYSISTFASVDSFCEFLSTRENWQKKRIAERRSHSVMTNQKEAVHR